MSAAAFLNGLHRHGPEYRDDEIFYYKSTQEMLTEKNFLSPTYFGEDRFQKPILHYWFMLASYAVFGVNWFAARFPSALFALGTVALTWLLARGYFGIKTAHLSALVVATLPLFFRHARNAVPDMPFTFFIVLSFYALVKFMDTIEVDRPTADRYSLLFFLSCGLGFMIKGFVAMIIPMGVFVLYTLMIKQTALLAQVRFGRGIFVMLIIIIPWFLYMITAHGESYLTYMLQDETFYRVTGMQEGNVFLARIKNFVTQFVFYWMTIMSFFAPYSIFLYGMIPITLIFGGRRTREGRGLMLFLIWFGLVWIFFSSIFFAISHYMMAMTVPFAILTSYSLLVGLEGKNFWEKLWISFQKYIIVGMFAIGWLAYLFLLVFLAGASKLWLAVLVPAGVTVLVVLIRSRDTMTAPFVLALFMLFGNMQPSLISDIGFTTHSVMQDFAETIHANEDDDFTVGVGSNGIHEKEFQVYFDRKVVKAGHSYEEGMINGLKALFNTDQKVYCLITEEDYNKYMRGEERYADLDILQEEYMFRKKMYLDKDFVKALMNFDQDTVHDYLMEKVILVAGEGSRD